MGGLKPIYCATHPRACSTAFERVFMTRRDLACVHEPFGDAFYYGPERLSPRYEEDEAARKASGFANSTYKTVFDRFDRESSEGQRLFIKDMISYLVPPEQNPAKIAPSLGARKRGIGTDNGANAVNGASSAPFPYNTDAESGNPTIVPKALLEQFHYTFLIRDPHSSIPSYFRCTIPPLDDVTGFYEFYPHEAGYSELRRFFDFAKESGLIRNENMEEPNGTTNGHINGHINVPEICLVDADDLLDDPGSIIKQYCQKTGLEFNPSMLNWDNEEDQDRARLAFEKWKGFHDDAINSKDLRPRKHKKATKSEAQWDAEWKEKYGEEGARVIRETVNANMDDYLYLKQFALKP
ncbi:uncharacterized protein A1O9_07035 [Exophiala aquamarina CBS 119918]|uniref:P-loop containing nucleoside triphosphate hydrolase protein n=1 Tax=Exophiala aquamarina CBS 119918 TaxID=1182545 RepID=A0A072PMV7_9EURO|nr:uncharacterized protein A1O9_07035 [Exophiala aquamarina CBS 119918]KEF56845.1 hypothetical protein A1O9_07035 [Exophiala aquamarina CBS 119918]